MATATAGAAVGGMWMPRGLSSAVSSSLQPPSVARASSGSASNGCGSQRATLGTASAAPIMPGTAAVSSFMVTSPREVPKSGQYPVPQLSSVYGSLQAPPTPGWWDECLASRELQGVTEGSSTPASASDALPRRVANLYSAGDPRQRGGSPAIAGFGSLHVAASADAAANAAALLYQAVQNTPLPTPGATPRKSVSASEHVSSTPPVYAYATQPASSRLTTEMAHPVLPSPTVGRRGWGPPTPPRSLSPTAVPSVTSLSATPQFAARPAPGNSPLGTILQSSSFANTPNARDGRATPPIEARTPSRGLSISPHASSVLLGPSRNTTAQGSMVLPPANALVEQGPFTSPMSAHLSHKVTEIPAHSPPASLVTPAPAMQIHATPSEPSENPMFTFSAPMPSTAPSDSTTRVPTMQMQATPSVSSTVPVYPHTAPMVSVSPSVPTTVEPVSPPASIVAPMALTPRATLPSMPSASDSLPSTTLRAAMSSGLIVPQLLSFPLEPDTLPADDVDWSPRNTVWKRYFAETFGVSAEEDSGNDSRTGISAFVGPHPVRARPASPALQRDLESRDNHKDVGEGVPEKDKEECASVIYHKVQEVSHAMPRLCMPTKTSPGGGSAGSLSSPAVPMSPGSHSSASTILRNHSIGSATGQNFHVLDDIGRTDMHMGSSAALHSSIEALRSAKAASESARNRWPSRRSPSRQNSATGIQGLHGSITEDSGPEQEPSPDMQSLRDLASTAMRAPAVVHERLAPSAQHDREASTTSGPQKQSMAPKHPEKNDAPSVRKDGGGNQAVGAVPERRRPTPPRTPPPETSNHSGPEGYGNMSTARESSGSSLRRLVGHFGAPPPEQPLSATPSATAAGPDQRQSSASQASEAPPRDKVSGSLAGNAARVASASSASRQRSKVSEADDALAVQSFAHERASAGAPRLATANRASRSRGATQGSITNAVGGGEEERWAALLAFKEQAAAVAAPCIVAPEDVAGAEAAANAAAAVAAAIQPRTFAELRSLRQPHQHVSQVIEAVAALFGLPEERWATLKRRLDNSLHHRLVSFDVIVASRLPRSRVESFMRLLRDHPAFMDRALHDKCPAVAPLQQWCLAVSQLLLRLHGDVLSRQVTPTRLRSVDPGYNQELQNVSETLRIDVAADHYPTVASSYVERPLAVMATDEAPPSPRSIVSADVSGGVPYSSVTEPPPCEMSLVDGPAPMQAVPSRLSSQSSDARMGQLERHFGGLTVEPDLRRLNEVELMTVRDLKIGRKGVGCVTFFGETDCRNLIHELPELLVIEQGEVVVYPDARRKPPIGEGLNKPASVVLYGCMPKSQQRLADPRARERYKQRVSEMTQEKGAVFEDYNCEDGTWRFRVNHF